MISKGFIEALGEKFEILAARFRRSSYKSEPGLAIEILCQEREELFLKHPFGENDISLDIFLPAECLLLDPDRIKFEYVYSQAGFAITIYFGEHALITKLKGEIEKKDECFYIKAVGEVESNPSFEFSISCQIEERAEKWDRGFHRDQFP